jgi:hypothetical protein
LGQPWRTPNTFRKLGITLERRGDDIYIPAHVNGYEVKQILMVLFLPLLMHHGLDLRQIY